MTSLVLTHAAKCRSGRRVSKEKVKLDISRVSEEWEVETRPPKRSHHPLQHVLLVLFLTSPLWTLFPHRGPKTATIDLLVNPFRGNPRNNPPSSPGSLPPPMDSFPLKTRNLPSVTFVWAAEDKVLSEKTETIKGLSSLAPSTKEVGAMLEINVNRMNSLPGGLTTSPVG